MKFWWLTDSIELSLCKIKSLAAVVIKPTNNTLCMILLFYGITANISNIKLLDMRLASLASSILNAHKYVVLALSSCTTHVLTPKSINAIFYTASRKY